MGLFGRKKGRHALGAAVTSIPSGPPAVAAPVYEPPVAPAAPPYEAPLPEVVSPEAFVAPSFASTTAEAVVQLLVTGEWAAGAEVPAPSVPEPVAAPDPIAVVAVRPPAPPAPRAAPGLPSLEATLVELLPTQEPPAVEEPTPAAPSRVQLGFRDGTSAPLDPQSDQFAQLEALAQSLTQRD